MKGPQLWIPVQVVIDGVRRVAPQAQLQAELVRCKAVWCSGRQAPAGPAAPARAAEIPAARRAGHTPGPPARLLPPAQRTALPRVTCDQITDAGLASAASKSTSYDGFHLRHLGHLCSAGQEVLATLWEACELSGLVPPQVHDVAAPLIPKKNGKLRDLGLFAGLIRVCTKARNEYCRQWEDQHDRPYFACGSARSTVDTVWRAALRAEKANACGSTAAAILQDMENFYQMVCHDRLEEQAAAHGFPAPLLRLALHLYRGPRHLMLAKSIAEAVTPNRGVLPGCAWACTLVKVYYLTAFDNFVARNPKALLDVFVDDIQTAAMGSKEAVVTILTEATEDLCRVVEHEIESRLVPAKAAVVASTDKLARSLRASLGELAGAPVVITEALGIDFASARARRHYASKSKIQARIVAVAKRRTRLRVMTKFGGKSARRLVTQGATPAALYGVAVTGVTEQQLTQLRRTAACATPPFASGRSLDIALQLSGLDPGPNATGAPLVRWAQEMWQATLPFANRALPVRDLLRAWQAVLAKPPKGWAQVRGPIGAAVLSAKRLQWNVNHPYLWVNDRGDELSLLEASPRLVEWHVRQSWERLISRRVARKLQAQGFNAQDTVGFAVVRQVLNSNAGSQLTALQKGALRAVACDAVWPKDRLIAAGYDVDRCVSSAEHNRIRCSTGCGNARTKPPSSLARKWYRKD